jgi:threonine/homoserine/homoserine lactone efflux protein
MPRFLKVFLAGLVVSFLGSLPLGTTNVAAMQLSIDRGLMPAFYFSAGSLTVELIYVRLSLFAVDWLTRRQKFMRYLNAITLLILLLLTYESFQSALYPSAASPIAISQVLPPFLFGMFLCSISTAQIPFWLGWSTILMDKKILYPNGGTYIEYLLGIGLGTFLANGIFIYTGQIAGKGFQEDPSLLHWVIGSFYLITASWQSWRMIRAHRMLKKVQED